MRSKKQDGENDTASIPDTAPLDEEYMPDHEVEDEHVEDNVDDEDEPMVWKCLQHWVIYLFCSRVLVCQ